MYTNYNIPQTNTNRPQNKFIYPNNGDRFIGGFVGPFILGGITGSLLTPRYNNQPPIYYAQPLPIPQPIPQPIPYYTNTNNYY